MIVAAIAGEGKHPNCYHPLRNSKSTSSSDTTELADRMQGAKEQAARKRAIVEAYQQC